MTFPNKIEVLRAAIDFLSCDCAGRSIASRSNCVALAEHAHKRLKVLETERPQRLRILLLGEFKSGKSTLINGLLGRVVAATDVFEMTSAVCRIIPAADGNERAILAGLGANLPEKEMSIAAFIDATKEMAAARRQDKTTSLSGYTQVQLYLNSPIDIELIDTPGLGATLENELTALDAISTSDVILWTMDVESLGGAREAAVLHRMKETEQPVMIALTKSDLVSEDEMEDIVAYAAKTYTIPVADIYPVSAQRQLATHDEAGFERLKSNLLSMSPKQARFREKALQAQASDIAAELKGGLELILTSLQEAESDASQNLLSMLDMASVVTQDICAATASILREKLGNEIEATLIGQLGARRTRLTQEDFANAINHSVKKVDTQEFWHSLKVHVEGQYQREWSEGLKAQMDILSKSIEDIRDEAREVTLQLSEEMYAEKSRRLARKQRAVGSAVEGGLIAMALVVTHLPVLAVAAVAGPSLWNWYSNKNSEKAEIPFEELEYQIRVAINDWLDKYIIDLMRDFRPRLQRENEIVAQAAAENYARQRENWPIDMSVLNLRIMQCQSHLESLSNIDSREPLLLEGY